MNTRAATIKASELEVGDVVLYNSYHHIVTAIERGFDSTAPNKSYLIVRTERMHTSGQYPLVFTAEANAVLVIGKADA